MRILFFLCLAAILCAFGILLIRQKNNLLSPLARRVETNLEELKTEVHGTEKPKVETYKADNRKKIVVMKDVGEAYMDYFGLKERDFELLKQAKIDVIEGNFDICASDSDVSYLLDTSYKYGLRVILPAGAGEAEWGYECDKEPYPKDQKPEWDRSAVSQWMNKWRSHPALFAWDISNEAGSVFPNASDKNMLTEKQLKQASNDVRQFDPSHPVMVRMNGWYFYDYENNFFRTGNPFARGVADIVMVNAYSNVEEYFSDFVLTVTDRAGKSIYSVDPKPTLIIALGVWEEKPLWVKPSVQQLENDLRQLKGKNILGVAYFKYGASSSEWYLPDKNIGAPELFSKISEEEIF